MLFLQLSYFVVPWRFAVVAVVVVVVAGVAIFVAVVDEGLYFVAIAVIVVVSTVVLCATLYCLKMRKGDL